MSQILPPALLNLINELGQLPGVGARTAERYAYFLLKNNKQNNQRLAQNISDLADNIKECPKTFALIAHNQEVSDLYTDSNRDKTVVALVEKPLDIVPIEKTNKFKGTYHVLGGVLSPIDGVTPDDLHIKELIDRIQQDSVNELIIATNASVEGESTALYIQKIIEEAGLNLTITRLAQGLPVGTDIEYADQITLGYALDGRKVIHARTS